MSASEVRARLRRAALHRADDASWRLARLWWRRRWEPSYERIAGPSAPTEPVGFLVAARAGSVRERDPQAVAPLVELADRYLAGRFRFFGRDEVLLGARIDWSLDPFTGRRWPRRHGKRIDYREARHGDPKWIWELNRCQHVPVLAQAWLLTGDDRYGSAAARGLLDWVSAHPPGRGIGWPNGFEAGVRAIALATTYDALRGSRFLDEPERQAVLRALWQHGHWIVRDPSTHSSANNHLVGELAGLAAVALLAPELKAAEAWLGHALTGLEREAGRQVLPDGTGAERAFAYHLFVVDLLLVVAALLVARGRSIPPGVATALARAAEGIAAEIGDDEPEPRYGDADDGRALRLDGAELRTARAVAAGLAAFLGHPDARRAAGRIDAAAAWLFGGEGADRFSSTVPAGDPGSCYLPDGGLVILRSGRRRVAVDVGPLGYLSLAAHGHADALQMTLVEEGEELVSDPGPGSYFHRPAIHSAFRSTGFHATVTVDDQDQSEAGGPFLWTSHATARPLLVDLERGIVIGEHDGYRRLGDPVEHRRAVMHSELGVVVVDRLESSALHRYRQTWPFHPSLEAEAHRGSLVRAARGSRPRLVVGLAATAPAVLSLVRGDDGQPAGWWSARLDSLTPAWHCRWEAEADGVLHLAAVLLPVANGAWPRLRVGIVPEGRGVRIVIDTADGRESLAVDLSDRERPLVRRLGSEPRRPRPEKTTVLA